MFKARNIALSAIILSIILSSIVSAGLQWNNNIANIYLYSVFTDKNGRLYLLGKNAETSKAIAYSFNSTGAITTYDSVDPLLYNVKYLTADYKIVVLDDGNIVMFPFTEYYNPPLNSNVTISYFTEQLVFDHNETIVASDIKNGYAIRTMAVAPNGEFYLLLTSALDSSTTLVSFVHLSKDKQVLWMYDGNVTYEQTSEQNIIKILVNDDGTAAFSFNNVIFLFDANGNLVWQGGIGSDVFDMVQNAGKLYVITIISTPTAQIQIVCLSGNGDILYEKSFTSLTINGIISLGLMSLDNKLGISQVFYGTSESKIGYWMDFVILDSNDNKLDEFIYFYEGMFKTPKCFLGKEGYYAVLPDMQANKVEVSYYSIGSDSGDSTRKALFPLIGFVFAYVILIQRKRKRN